MLRDLISREFLRRRWPHIVAAAVILGAAGSGLMLGGGSKQTAPRAAVPVSVTAVERRDVPHISEVAGTVESLHSVVIRAQVDGVLTDILFTEGDLVEVGQVLAHIDDRGLQAALAAAKGQLARDAALLRAAEQDFKRSQDLALRGNVSRQVIDKQAADVDQLKAAVQVSEARVKTADVNLSYTRITSPVRGRVGIRRIDAGNVVRASDANGLVSVAQVDPISVVFPVPQAVLSALRSDADTAGGGVVEAFDRGGSNEVLARGRISAFDNGVDVSTGTAKVRATFDNKTERLSPGQFVAVRFRTGVSAQALVIPAVAVRPGLEGNYVFRVVNNKAERVIVTTAYTDDVITVVTQGLTTDDMVVIDGTSRLAPGTTVNVRENKSPKPVNESSSSSASAGAQGMQ